MKQKFIRYYYVVDIILVMMTKVIERHFVLPPVYEWLCEWVNVTLVFTTRMTKEEHYIHACSLSI